MFIENDDNIYNFFIIFYYIPWQIKKDMLKYIKRNNLNRNEIIMVGDQILTDVIASKNVKVKVILTEPLVNKDLLVTKINRFIDKIIRRIIRKKLKRLEVD